MRPGARMSDAQYAATVTELVRLTLGGRPHRPELVAAIPEPRKSRKGRR